MIIFTTTFRPFNDSQNDGIQIEFIKSLSRQTSSKWLLIVSQFADENVKDIVKKYIPKKCIFFNNQVPYNHTDVVINAINYIRESINADRRFIVWTNSDLIYPPSFVEDLLKLDNDIQSFIVYPNKHLRGLYTSKTYKTNLKNDGIDCIGFLVSNKLQIIQQSLEKYRTDGYGYFEYILALVVKNNSTRTLNLNNFITIPTKVENPRDEILFDYSKAKYQSINNRNMYLNLLIEYGLSRRYISPILVGSLFGSDSKLKNFKSYLHYLSRKFITNSYLLVRKLIPLRMLKLIKR